MNILIYSLRDVREGIKRNAAAAIATILLVFISLSISGSFLLMKTGLDNVTNFLSSQVKIKIFVDPSVNTQEVAQILRTKGFTQNITIETKEETLNNLRQFFQGKSYLFDSFKDSHLPDTILLDLKDKSEIDTVAKGLKSIKGITDVIYAQTYAHTILSWSSKINRYGLIVLALMIACSFLTVHVAVHLGLYQRQKEIQVKLLLGAKVSHVRNQILFEGFLLGLIGSLFASSTLFLLYEYVLYQLQMKFYYIFTFSIQNMNLIMLSLIACGGAIGLLGSYFATRKMLKNG
ncbi:FtsX-like permease family protein [Bacillus salipaludis]|uniref:Cell division protein FtsX n=1 Tax=Bacillus salipaludis TaxID=2547811 RepID=A0A4R5VIA5_9BACI|nr:permease-like cell division protein FtsX [Bacillus salipaludis]TDK55945.1 FtsX-like permease family protein [Bacillus salipaludis]